MFTTQINPTHDFTNARQVINYVNAFPGTGKTYAFIHNVALPHVRNRHNSILVYAAPTAALLSEVEQELIANGLTNKQVYTITSETTKKRVADTLQTALIGRRATPQQQKIDPLPDGCIVLTTHECIARFPYDAPGRNRVSLVYDEARACLQENYALNMPDAVFQFLTEPRPYPVLDEEGEPTGRYQKRRCIRQTEVEAVETPDSKQSFSLSIWKWNHACPMPDNAALTSMVPVTKQQAKRVAALTEFLNNVQASGLDMYVSIKRDAKKAEYRISNVLSPARMFRGFGSVLILSAMFESSQMFRFLSSPAEDTTYPPVLRDITKEYVSRKRVNKLLQRMRNVYITYALDLGNRTISKGDLFYGLAVPGLDKDAVTELNREWSAIHGGRRPREYFSEFDRYDGAPRAGTIEEDNSAQEAFMARLVQAGATGSVLQHLTETALRLQRAFFKEHGLKRETLPVIVNPSYREDFAARNAVTPTWTAHGLDKINLRTVEYPAPKSGALIEQVPVVSHGQNKWGGLHSIAFLASMKYNNEECAILQHTIPEYDPAIDRTFDYALQGLWRANVRRVTDKPVLLIVPDRYLAERLQARFHALAKEFLGDDYARVVEDDELQAESHSPVLPILAPHRLIQGYEEPTILLYAPNDKESMRRRDQNRKASVRGIALAGARAAYRRSPDGTRYSALSVAITRARKAGKDTTAMEAERASLQTFAQWKRTPDGLAALEGIRNENRSQRSTRDKLLTVLNTPEFWAPSRSERLVYCLAALHAGIKREEVTAYPTEGGTIPRKNWNDNKTWMLNAKPDAYILARAKTLGIKF
ncbi:hypothetical protein KDW67_34465 [Burkholderia cenocepacia]|uniref:hypothetical protein n=1 Tax=Burkholderia cenocepacia TaxID=95486 RepID=UPI00097CB6D8|nr:hypothetical protein [Burkholderia cenocepacia]AQQ46736.1 hypothetical protein A8F32_13090 [Burkholderia cenocepacia]MBR8265079.1 hypothetical protein [Burkholderia cenocepacia]ONI97072.1 hypothetical protein A8F33_33205 [Burkholderia cenocepacia]ONJ01596.1 hypothetical protein A8F53_16430 [Burkholderia cenocepacia]ONJ33921.1 hypothetical protein A8F38_07365 [Burkholderia cenocepacia]